MLTIRPLGVVHADKRRWTRRAWRRSAAHAAAISRLSAVAGRVVLNHSVGDHDKRRPRLAAESGAAALNAADECVDVERGERALSKVVQLSALAEHVSSRKRGSPDLTGNTATLPSGQARKCSTQRLQLHASRVIGHLFATR